MKRTVVLLCAAILLTPISYSAAAAYHYAYAYMTVSPQDRDNPQNDQNLRINIIDPSDPSLTPLFSTFSMPLTPHYYLHGAFASPNGKWIALLFITDDFASRENTELWLFDVQTRQVRRIAKFYTGEEPPSDRQLLYAESGVVWSPDSQYIIWTAIKTQSGMIYDHLSIYSVETSKVDSLTPEASDALEFYFDWSQDGKRLVVLNAGQGSDHWITIYDISQKKQIASIKFEGPNPFSPCYLDWSPDERYVIFSSFCQMMDKANYILDIQREAVTQLGNVESDPLPRTVYDKIYWYDKHTLVAGVNVRSNTTGEVTQTIAYEWPTDRQVILEEDKLNEWVANPILNNIVALSSRDVQVGNFNGHTFQPQIHAPLGHGLKWSPDGKILPYWNSIEVSADDMLPFQNLSEIVFVQPANTSVNRHALVFDKGDRSVPIG